MCEVCSRGNCPHRPAENTRTHTRRTPVSCSYNAQEGCPNAHAKPRLDAQSLRKMSTKLDNSHICGYGTIRGRDMVQYKPTEKAATLVGPFILLIAPLRVARKCGSSSVISPLALYLRSPDSTSGTARGGQIWRRVMSFLCRHPYQKTAFQNYIISRPCLSGLQGRYRVPPQAGPRWGSMPLQCWAPCVY